MSTIVYRASKRMPCPICRGDHACSATAEGLHFCWRATENRPGWKWIKRLGNGFNIFADEYSYEEYRNQQRDRRARGDKSRDQNKHKSKKNNTNNRQEYPDEILIANLAGPYEIAELSHMLNVLPSALVKLCIGFRPETEREKRHWLTPQRDGKGHIVGLHRRYVDGSKKIMQGHTSGLTYAHDLNVSALTSGSLVLLVEGASDVAAAGTVGLVAVGRPSKDDGVEELAELFAGASCLPVVVGENDAHFDKMGKWIWPGREGAERTSLNLAAALGREVPFVFPPPGVKDLREWIWAIGVDGQPRQIAQDQPPREQSTENGSRVGTSEDRTSSAPFSPLLNLRDEVSCAAVGRAILEAILADERISRNQYVRVEHMTSKGEYEGGEKEATDCIICSTRTKRETVHKLTTDEIPDNARQIILNGTVRRPCPVHRVPFLQSRKNSTHCRVLHRNCDRFECDVCGAKKRSAWLLNLMRRYDEFDSLFFGRFLNRTKTDSAIRAIRRAEGCYVRFADGNSNGAYMVICSCNIKGVLQVNHCEALHITANQLNGALSNESISTCYCWKLENKTHTGDWKRRGAGINGSFGNVVADLERRNLDPFVQESDRGAKADWSFPADMPEEQIDVIFDALQARPSDHETDVP
jgi:hypothetical protein